MVLFYQSRTLSLAAICFLIPDFTNCTGNGHQLGFASTEWITLRSRSPPLNKMGLFNSKQEDWHEEAERLRTHFLDPWYNKLLIRKSTVEVAKEYGEGSSKYGGIFPGVHKYLGGAVDERDGCIYGIPSHARSLICLYPTETEGYKIRIDPLPEHVADTKFKWLRGIIAHGYLYGVPAWANCVLEVDIDAMWGRREAKGALIKLIPLPEGHVPQQWQWHGAALNREKTAIYSIPSNARKVLKVDLTTHSTTFIDIEIPDGYKSFSWEHTNKWYGGILGDDNAVYGMPYRTCSVLRIDTETDTATIVGPDYGSKLFNWHGGIKKNGIIYAHPSHADTVLAIDTRIESRGQKQELLKIHRAPYDTDSRKNYKWLGGATGADGNIYSMPADTSSILKIDTKTNHCTTFGFVGKEKNKWQGGVLSPSDGCIYCIPADGQSVLRIDTRPEVEGENPIALIGNLPKRRDKWQGAFIGKDGIMYAIPEGGYRILKVTPAPERQEWKNGVVPKNVKVEMM
jgi:hypothetical protein